MDVTSYLRAVSRVESLLAVGGVISGMAVRLIERPQTAAAPAPCFPEPALHRDREWFAGVYAATCDSVYRYALMLLREPSIAEDIAAEAYLRAWRARDRFGGRGTAISWLLSITRNCAIDELRKQRELVQLDPEAELEDCREPLQAELSDHDLAAIHAAIRRLTNEQQQVIFLRFYEELPHEAVAVRLGRTPNAVRAIQFRALARMRRLLEAERA